MFGCIGDDLMWNPWCILKGDRPSQAASYKDILSYGIKPIEHNVSSKKCFKSGTFKDVNKNKIITK